MITMELFNSSSFKFFIFKIYLLKILYSSFIAITENKNFFKVLITKKANNIHTNILTP